jgi:hypothetical protein
MTLPENDDEGKREGGTDGREETGDVAGVVVRYQMAESGG